MLFSNSLMLVGPFGFVCVFEVEGGGDEVKEEELWVESTIGSGHRIGDSRRLEGGEDEEEGGEEGIGST